MKQIIRDMQQALNQRPERESLSLFVSLSASQMVYSDEENFIQFKIKGDRDVNKIKVIYDKGQDLYNVEFWNIRGLKSNMKDSIQGLGWEQLAQAIWRRSVLI